MPYATNLGRFRTIVLGIPGLPEVKLYRHRDKILIDAPPEVTITRVFDTQHEAPTCERIDRNRNHGTRPTPTPSSSCGSRGSAPSPTARAAPSGSRPRSDGGGPTSTPSDRG